ncbi:TPA: hypothetical protein ACF3DG_000760 [Enterococcus faecium]
MIFLDKDLKNAIEKISDFFEESDKQILLLKGFDNDAKIRASLFATNDYFKKCILLVNVMKEAPRFVNNAFRREKILPNAVNSKEIYTIGKMKVGIYSYATSSSRQFFGDNESCTIVCPVQTVLDDKKRFEIFMEELKKIKSKKIILITTNEWSIKNWDIESMVDEVIFFSVENDNPELMQNLRINQAI